MTIVTIQNSAFDLLQADPPNFTAVDLNFDQSYYLDQLGSVMGDTPTPLQISSSVIRMSWDYGIYYPWTFATYELRINGTGMGPISSVQGFMTALNYSLASGGVSSVMATRFSSYYNQSEEVFRLDIAPTAWTLTTGLQSIKVTGALPSTFQGIYELERLIGRADDLDTMTSTERTTYFNDLSKFGLNGLSVTDNGTELFSLTETTSLVSLKLGGVTLSLTGSFPANLGNVASILWDAQHQLDTTGTINYATLAGLSIGTLTAKNAAGAIMMTATNLTQEGTVYNYAGRGYGEWVGSDANNGSDFLTGRIGDVNSLITGLGGHDNLFGFAGNDALIGGDGNDTLTGGDGSDLLNGGAGFDRVVYTSSAALRVDLSIVGATQVTGQGADALVGIEAVTTGNGNDYIKGDAASNHLNAGLGNDLIEAGLGHDTLIGGYGNDTLAGGIGDDYMSGGFGSDVFRFYATNGVTAQGIDVISDFMMGQDRLTFTPTGTAAPWAGMTNAQFVANFAHIEHGNIVIVFRQDSFIVLDDVNNFTSTAGLVNALTLF